MKPYQDATNFLRDDGVLLVPTDTNYAFAVDPWNESACRRLYEIKKRDIRKPLTIFIANPDDLWEYVTLSEIQRREVKALIEQYWPGPLNLVLPRSQKLPVHPYLMEDSVSLVCNTHPELKGLIVAFERPLAMSSANLSGTQHDTLIDHALATALFAGKVDHILAPGTRTGGTTQSSTIVSLMGDKLQVLRQGDLVIDAAEN